MLYTDLRSSPTRTLFPYTTLFRSPLICSPRLDVTASARYSSCRLTWSLWDGIASMPRRSPRRRSSRSFGMRSEEHTSELQSHHDLVCRLLLENKNRQPAGNS